MIDKGFSGEELLFEDSVTRVLDDLAVVIEGLYFYVWRGIQRRMNDCRRSQPGLTVKVVEDEDLRVLAKYRQQKHSTDRSNG